MEKVNGVNKREKFRIRYYNDNPDFIRLEKKSKVNNLSSKESTVLTKRQVEKILRKDYDWLKHTDDPLLVEFYYKIKTKQLRPKKIIDYIREPYIFSPGNVRITFDSNIRISPFDIEVNPDKFFDSNLITINDPNNTVLMEVKWDEFLPDIVKDVIRLRGRRPAAFSKYELSRLYS